MNRQTIDIFNIGHGRKQARLTGEFHGRSFRPQ